MSGLQTLLQRYQVKEDPLRTLRRLEMVVLVLVLLLCLQLGYGALRLAATDVPESLPPAADSMLIPAVVSPSLLPAQARDELIERPLFWAGRSPGDDGEGPEPKKKSGQLKDVKLVGVFGSGDQAGIIALVKDRKRRILVGEMLEGWELRSIDSEGINLTNGERSETLSLKRGNVKQAAPAFKEAVKKTVGRAVRPSASPSIKGSGAAPDDVKPEAKAPSKQVRPRGKTPPSQGLGLGPR